MDIIYFPIQKYNNRANRIAKYNIIFTYSFFWLREFVMFVLLQFSTMVQQNLHRFECTRIVAQNQSTRKKGNDIHDTCHRIQNKFLDRSQAVKLEDRPVKGWPHRFPLQPANRKGALPTLLMGNKFCFNSYFLLGFVKNFFHQKWVVSFVKFLPSFLSIGDVLPRFRRRGCLESGANI